MSLTTHYRAAELHSLAAHTHLAAASARDKQDHLTAHELTKKAHEYSTEAHQHSEKLLAELNAHTESAAQAK
jgi:hypothetical protein